MDQKVCCHNYRKRKVGHTVILIVFFLMVMQYNFWSYKTKTFFFFFVQWGRYTSSPCCSIHVLSMQFFFIFFFFAASYVWLCIFMACVINLFCQNNVMPLNCPAALHRACLFLLNLNKSCYAAKMKKQCTNFWSMPLKQAQCIYWILLKNFKDDFVLWSLMILLHVL
jgi:hypothetical protein